MSVDFHTHILPGIDDGSKSTKESIEMIEKELEMGVDTIVATPHFYATHQSVEKFLKERKHSYEKLCKELEKKSKANNIKIHLGAEVYYFPGIGKAKEVKKLCIEGTGVILLEMPFCQWTKDHYKDVKDIISHLNLTVVLAHIERFLPFQKDKKYWNKIMELPVYKQINGETFLSLTQRGKWIRYVKKGEKIILGSDCHNLKKRKPNLDKAGQILNKKTGKNILLASDEIADFLIKSE